MFCKHTGSRLLDFHKNLKKVSVFFLALKESKREEIRERDKSNREEIRERDKSNREERADA